MLTCKTPRAAIMHDPSDLRVPQTDVALQFEQLTAETCVHTLSSFMEYISGMQVASETAEDEYVEPEPEVVRSVGAPCENILDEIDNSAFGAPFVIENIAPIDFEKAGWDMSVMDGEYDAENAAITSKIEISQDFSNLAIQQDYLEALETNAKPVVLNGFCERIKPAIKMRLFNSNLSWKLFGGNSWSQTRDKDFSVQFHLVWCNADWTASSGDTQPSRELRVYIRDIEVIDNIKSSRWRKFFAYQTPDATMLPRETDSDMLVIIWKQFQQDFSDCALKLRVLPIRMYIDQVLV